jgi:alpha-galactosidase
MKNMPKLFKWSRSVKWMKMQTIGTAFLCCLVVSICVLPACGLDNGLVPTPPIGWNSWNAFELKVDEAKVRATADSLVSSGMRDAGYQYVVVDAGWKAKTRDAEGRLAADPVAFPSGMKALVEYVHAKGLKFGIYTDAGSEDCGSGAPGSKDHEGIDARTFAAWGVDFVKEDWCHSEGLDARAVYTKMSKAIQSTGRPMILSLCEWGDNKPWEWAAVVGNLWRTTGDGKDCWDCGRDAAAKLGGYPRGWTLILDAQVGLEKYAGPGHWNDPDLLLVGMPGLSVEEARAHFSLWSILAAPLMASCDLATMPPAIAEILKNREVIAVDQDALGKEGTRVSPAGEHEVWARQLKDGSRAVALFNRGSAAAPMSFSRRSIGLRDSESLHVRDLWNHRELEVPRGGYSARVPAHGVVLLLVREDTASAGR